jgi:hypothetical protein
MSLPLDAIERETEVRGREVQRLILEAHIRERGTGDVGPAIEVVSSEKNGPRILRHRRIHERKAVTIFGEVKVQRMAYSDREEAAIHPMDEALDLPERSFSYEVQRRIVKAAVQGPFDEAIERLEESTGVRISKRSAEDVVKDAAEDFEAFYEARAAPPPESSGPILVGAVDGKGIPMVKPAEPASEPGVWKPTRRKKGEKANKKRMATVATVYTTEPRVRTPQDVIDSFFWKIKKEGQEPVRPEAKRVWASLKEPKEAVIDAVREEMSRRDPLGVKRHVVLTDGERALQILVAKKLGLSITLILDFLHVLEKLWKAAYVFHAEGTEEATDWVWQRALRILEGEVSQVVKGLRQMVTKRRLRGEARKTLLSVAGYFYRNRSRMRYDEYLRDGLPIASGAVEGACKNLVKDRMERSGMRWREDPAEAMLKLRATYLSDDFAEYWDFHVRHDQERLHPPASWRPHAAVVGK